MEVDGIFDIQMSVKKWGVSRFFFVFVAAFLTTWLTLNLFTARASDLSVVQVIDGDTVVMSNGQRVRLLGIDAPDRGVEGSEKAGVILESMLKNGRVWVEGDRYEEDTFGRRLGWLWVNCESEPEFKPDNYMSVVYEQRRGKELERKVESNPMGCKAGLLINEQLLKMGLVKTYFVDGELKYSERLRQVKGLE